MLTSAFFPKLLINHDNYHDILQTFNYQLKQQYTFNHQNQTKMCILFTSYWVYSCVRKVWWLWRAIYRRADRRVDRRVEWYRCLKLDMHILCKYVYIDASGVLGVQYMYVCMHVCMYYVCMYVCTLFGSPIPNRRADRRAAWYRCVPS